MSDYIYFLQDVKDEDIPFHLESEITRLTDTEPIDDYIGDMLALADDGLPVSEPVDVAEDGGVVVIWPRMYEEVGA